MFNIILEDIRSMVFGGNNDEAYAVFDTELIIHLNTVFAILNQMGIGKPNFTIVTNDETWHDFLGDKEAEFSAVKSYVALRVKKLFDPPTSSAVSAAMEDSLKELEYRIYTLANYQ